MKKKLLKSLKVTSENWHTEYPDYYKEWHTEHPNYYKEWRAKHPGYYAAMSREWRLEHPNYHAQWCVENKEKVRHYSRKRDKRLKDADGSYTLDEWNNLIEKYASQARSLQMKMYFLFIFPGVLLQV